jgi:hypothetical protein
MIATCAEEECFNDRGLRWRFAEISRGNDCLIHALLKASQRWVVRGCKTRCLQWHVLNLFARQGVFNVLKAAYITDTSYWKLETGRCTNIDTPKNCTVLTN